MSLTDKKKSCITRFRKSIDTNILKPDTKDEFQDGNKSVQRKTVSSPNNSNDRFREHQSRIKNWSLSTPDLARTLMKNSLFRPNIKIKTSEMAK